MEYIKSGKWLDEDFDTKTKPIIFLSLILLAGVLVSDMVFDWIPTKIWTPINMDKIPMEYFDKGYDKVCYLRSAYNGDQICAIKIDKEKNMIWESSSISVGQYSLGSGYFLTGDCMDFVHFWEEQVNENGYTGSETKSLCQNKSVYFNSNISDVYYEDGFIYIIGDMSRWLVQTW